jgi:flavin reductase (DIM6/NTAB) family NADH-FMN oxidoreductase RutF
MSKKTMRTIVPGEIPTRELHQFLLGVVSPRPIAFVSTMNEAGQPNLAPYSFFNAFSSNPPMLVFSSNRRVTDNTTKDTLANIKATGECVVNVVNYDIVRQMTIASVEFGPEVNEFEQAGFTHLASEVVKPPRVAESPAQMECQVEQIIPLGEQGGAGHLILCRVVRLHIAESVIDEKDRIDPNKIDLMGRMGRAFYVRASGAAVFPIVQEVTKMVIGFPGLPPTVLHSHVLTGNELGRLAGLNQVPDPELVVAIAEAHLGVAEARLATKPLDALHGFVSQELLKNDMETASALAWYGESL